MNRDKITSLEYGMLTFFLLNSFLMNIGYNTITNISNNDSILDILIGGIGIVILGFLWNKYKDNIVNNINKYPTYIKYFIYIILFIIILICTIYSISGLTSFIHYYILKEVNKLIITITITVTILYIVSKGIKTITKTSEIFFYIYLLIILIGFIGLIKYIDLINLKPLFTTSIKDNINSSTIYFLSSIFPFLLLTSIPKKEVIMDNKKHHIFLILTVILTFIQLIIIISVLGINLTNIYQNPDMMVYKKISFLNVLERVEVLLALNNILNILFFIITSTYFMKELVNKIIGNKKEHITLALIGLILIILSNILEIEISLYIGLSIAIFYIIFIYIIKYSMNKYTRL